MLGLATRKRADPGDINKICARESPTSGQVQGKLFCVMGEIFFLKSHDLSNTWPNRNTAGLR